MDIKIERSDLFKSLDAVGDIVPTKTAIPVISHLLIEASGDQGIITVSATDLDISITTSVPAEVRETGRTTVPARKFIEIIRELPDGLLNIITKDNKIILNSASIEPQNQIHTLEGQSLQPGQGMYILMGLPSEDYPELPSQIEGTYLRFDGSNGLGGEIFKDMISKTAFAVSKDETRPVLNGVLCQVRMDGLTMVATDGHRLVRHFKSMDLNKHIQGTDHTEAIIPPRALQHLAKLLSSGNALVQCIVGNNHVLFDLGNTRLFSRLIEGPYVDFEQVIPKNNTNRLCVSSSALTPSVRRVSILSNMQTHQIRLHLTQNELELSATSQDVGGEARESIQADYSGMPMEIGYNSQYLLEILKRIDSEDVVFDLNTPITAGVVRPAIQPEGEDYLCLLMPLRLNE